MLNSSKAGVPHEMYFLPANDHGFDELMRTSRDAKTPRSDMPVRRLSKQTTQENEALRSLVEPLRVAMDNAAKRALVLIENKRTFLDVSA